MMYKFYGTTYELKFQKGRYSNNRLAIQVLGRREDEDWYEPFCTLTVNLPDVILSSDGSKDLPSNMAFIDTNNCPEYLFMQLADEGVMTVTKTRARSGYCTYPLVKFDEDWLASL